MIMLFVIIELDLLAAAVAAICLSVCTYVRPSEHRTQFIPTPIGTRRLCKIKISLPQVRLRENVNIALGGQGKRNPPDPGTKC